MTGQMRLGQQIEAGHAPWLGGVAASRESGATRACRSPAAAARRPPRAQVCCKCSKFERSAGSQFAASINHSVDVVEGGSSISPCGPWFDRSSASRSISMGEILPETKDQEASGR